MVSGERYFLKVGGPVPDPSIVDSHRGEGRLARALPADLPTSRLIDVYDTSDWIGLVYEEVRGRNPRLPWSAADLDAVLGSIEDLAVTGTPAPAAILELATRWSFAPGGWARIANETDLLNRIDDPFVHGSLDEFVRLEMHSAEAGAGDTLLHLDIRADNVLMADSGPVFVDWSHATLGARWVDLALFLPSVAMQGGPKPAEIFDRHSLGRCAATDDVSAVVCALAGFYLDHGLRPPAPGRAAVRRFQYIQGLTALEWLKSRLG